MATLTQNIYEILDGNLTIPEYWAGVGGGNRSAKSGLLTFFLLPSPPKNIHDGTSVSQYQFDIWHEDIYQAEEYKEELVSYLSGLAGIHDGKSLIFSMDSDLGGIQEDEGNIWHYPVVFNIKWARR